MNKGTSEPLRLGQLDDDDDYTSGDDTPGQSSDPHAWPKSESPFSIKLNGI